MPVRIGDINYGGHLGNDAVLSLLHEARIRFLHAMGFSEKDVAGVGLIMADAAIQYRSEAFYGEQLNVEVGLSDMQSAGCDFLYRIKESSTGREIARAKTAIVFFDYASKRPARTPAPFAAAAAPLIVSGWSIKVDR